MRKIDAERLKLAVEAAIPGSDGGGCGLSVGSCSAYGGPWEFESHWPSRFLLYVTPRRMAYISLAAGSTLVGGQAARAVPSRRLYGQRPKKVYPPLGGRGWVEALVAKIKIAIDEIEWSK